MATVFYVLGTVVLLVGLAAIGFGTPASALDFGNTLLVIGTTASVGGLLLIALGAVVAQLQRIAENLAFDAERHAQPAFKPAPPEPLPRPMPNVGMPEPFEPRGPAVPPEFPMPQPPAAPKLPNPDEPSARSEDAGRQDQEPALESVASRDPLLEPPPPDTHQAMPPAPSPPSPPRPSLPDLPKRRASLFDSVWPSRERQPEPLPEAEPAAAEPIASGIAPQPALEHPPPPEHPTRPLPEPPRSEPKPHTVAILKSGVVDGMGYTLYVDGSIEAELPQGTVRFASIQELRDHLEKGG